MLSRRSASRLFLTGLGAICALAFFSGFAVAAEAPTVTVGSATEFSLNTATAHGTVKPNGASTTYKIEYGKTKLYGQSTVAKGAGSTGEKAIDEILVGLEPMMTYHYRISATNSLGTTYSSDVPFEMLLQWKLNGEPVDQAAEKLGENVRLYHTVLSGGKGKGVVKFSNPISSMEVICDEQDTSVPYKSGYGLLGSEYHISLNNCKAYKSGVLLEASCQPLNQPKLTMSSVLTLTANVTFEFNEETCFQIVTFTPLKKGDGFALGAITEGWPSIPISMSVKKEGNWTTTATGAEWQQEVKMRLGIS